MFIVIGNPVRQIVFEGLSRVVLIADKNKDHPVHFLDWVGAQRYFADQRVFLRSDDIAQVAAFQVVGKTVVPARDGVLGKTGGPGRKPHAPVQAFVPQRVDPAVGPAQGNGFPGYLDSL